MIKKILGVIILCMLCVSPINVKANTSDVPPVDCYIGENPGRNIVITWSRPFNVRGYEIYRAHGFYGKYHRYITINEGMINRANINQNINSVYKYKMRAYRLDDGVKVYGDFGDELVISTRKLTTKNVKAYYKNRKTINFEYNDLKTGSGYQILTINDRASIRYYTPKKYGRTYSKWFSF